ncbi:MAG: PfkB family carbohydrate kinase [Xanthomonadales bacterium]|nr:PfkB family carbohydrate kinase [Xanthomonadales bacterium]
MLKPNAEELGALLRARGETAPDPGELPSLADEALHALCRRLAPGTVLLTLGAEGVFVSHGEIRHGDAVPCYRQPAAAAPRVVDTVGAGDAFAGALAAFLDLRPGRPLAEAVAFAQRAAALKIGREGAASAMPRREELAPG